MKVFISWSGDLSKRVAEVLKEWIPNVLQNAEPWMSSSDIEKGAIWFDEISSSLAAGSVGVICLTRDNVTAPWILFEAGALAKGLTKSRVCTFLLEANPSELKPPLSQFNATMPTKEEMVKLIKTINASDKDKAIADKRVEDAAEHWWPVFERKFQAALKSAPASTTPKRTSEDMIAEILTATRSIQSYLEQQRITDQTRVSNEAIQTWLKSALPFHLAGLDYTAPIGDNQVVRPALAGLKLSSQDSIIQNPLATKPEQEGR